MNRKENRKKKGKSIFKNVVVFVLVLLYKSLRWAQGNYANISLEQIVFHLNMTLEGTSNDLIKSYVKNALIPAIIIAMGICIGCVILSKMIKEDYYLIIGIKTKKICVNLKKSIFTTISLLLASIFASSTISSI